MRNVEAREGLASMVKEEIMAFTKGSIGAVRAVTKIFDDARDDLYKAFPVTSRLSVIKLLTALRFQQLNPTNSYRFCFLFLYSC